MYLSPSLSITGLEMIINIDQVTYIGDLANTAGVRVLIDYQGNMPFPEDLGLSVGPGFETSIGLQLVCRLISLLQH